MIIGEGISKDVGRIAVWFFLRYMILALPSPSEVNVNGWLGSWFFLCSRTKKELVCKNLATVFGKRSEVNRFARKAFQNHFIDQYLIFSFPKMRTQDMNRYLTLDGCVHLDDALKRGKGVIMIHGHVGPRLLPLFHLGRMGYKIHQIEGPAVEGLSLFGRYCARQKRLLERLIPANFIDGQQFLRPAFEALKRNEIVMIAGDGMGGRKFMGRQVTVDFLGYRLRFPAGPVILAGKTGASLVPLLTVNGEGDAPYRAMIYPPWSVPKTRLGKEELTSEVKKFVSLLETVVRAYPYLWHFWDEFFDRMSDT